VGELDCAGEGVKLVGLTPFPILPAHFGGCGTLLECVETVGAD
jgi:hypothetical protein